VDRVTVTPLVLVEDGRRVGELRRERRRGVRSDDRRAGRDRGGLPHGARRAAAGAESALHVPVPGETTVVSGAGIRKFLGASGLKLPPP
jgi:hypothetical protein